MDTIRQQDLLLKILAPHFIGNTGCDGVSCYGLVMEPSDDTLVLGIFGGRAKYLDVFMATVGPGVVNGNTTESDYPPAPFEVTVGELKTVMDGASLIANIVSTDRHEKLVLMLHKAASMQENVDDLGEFARCYLWGTADKDHPDLELFAERLRDIHKFPLVEDWYEKAWDLMLEAGYVTPCVSHGVPGKAYSLIVKPDETVDLLLDRLAEMPPPKEVIEV